MTKGNKGLLLLPPGLGAGHCPEEFIPVCTVCDFGPGTRVYKYSSDASPCRIAAVNMNRFAGGVPIAWAAQTIKDACGEKGILLYGGNTIFARQLASCMEGALIPEKFPEGLPFSAAVSRTTSRCAFLSPAFYMLRVSGRKRNLTFLSPGEAHDLISGRHSKVFYSKPERSYYINTGGSEGVEFLFFDTCSTLIKKATALLSHGITPVVRYGELQALMRFPLPGLSS